jgi:hypothetical protein
MVVGQFEKFAPVLKLCRRAERIAKTKSELGAQRPAEKKAQKERFCGQNLIVDSLAGRCAPSSDFV